MNSVANTVITNSSGVTLTFEDNITIPGDSTVINGSTIYTLAQSSSVIQSTAGSNITVDNVITGAGNALTYLGGGNSGTTGATLELGAGSSNDVSGAYAPNVPHTFGNGAPFTSSASVHSSDQNGFTGGLTIGDTNGTANAGVVKIDGANALPASGAVTVNPNSQLLLNGNATYGGSSQNLTLNGTGTPATGGALALTTGDNSTWNGNITVASASSINVQGAAGSLAVSGTLSGSSVLETAGAGTLTLNGNSTAFSGGVDVNSGSLVGGNSGALGTGPVAVAGGTLSASGTLSEIGALSLSTGVIALNQSTFDLSSGQNFTMSGGTLDLTDVSGSVGAITSDGGGSSFSISSGILDLGGNTWNYSNTYDILAGFGTGSISGLTVTDYDTTDYTANVSNAGVLSFTSVPEPSTWATMLAGLASLALFQFRRMRGGFRKA